jgi:hypothetical protein
VKSADWIGFVNAFKPKRIDQDDLLRIEATLRDREASGLRFG